MRYLTSGESHGPQLTVIVEGIPANLEIKVEDINKRNVQASRWLWSWPTHAN